MIRVDSLRIPGFTACQSAGVYSRARARRVGSRDRIMIITWRLHRDRPTPLLNI